MIHRFQPFLVVPLTVLALVLAACAGEPTATPSPTPAPTATPTRPAAPTATPTPASRYPMTLTDMRGRAVQINARPTKIVTLSPTSTEMLYRVGGTAVGRDTSSRFPPEAQSVPTVGGAYTPNVEAIVALQPDVVILEGITQGRMLETLSRVGAPVLFVQATTVEDVARSLALVGKAIDREAAAATAAAEIQQRVAAQKNTASASTKVLVLISDAERNVYAAKPESYTGAVVSLVGLTNGAAGMPDSGPYPGFSLVTAEKLLSIQPDVILTISPAPPPAPTLSQSLPRVPGFAEAAAVKAGRVREVSPELLLQAPGPRIADAVEHLAAQVKDAMK